MTRQQIIIPETCPCCESRLQFVNDQLFCTNKSCQAQLYKKLEHFAKVLGIKGLGPKTVEKLKLEGIEEVFYLDLNETADLLGSQKVAEKLLQEIKRAEEAQLSTVLAAFSIPLIGEVASKKICSVISRIDDISPEACKKAGLGEKASSNLLAWLSTEFLEIREFLPFNFVVANDIVSKGNSITVCVTGKLSSFKTKSEAHAELLKAGYTPVDSVTKTTNILVDESGASSSKRQKAEQYGIKIITDLSQFLNKESNTNDNNQN